MQKPGSKTIAPSTSIVQQGTSGTKLLGRECHIVKKTTITTTENNTTNTPTQLGFYQVNLQGKQLATNEILMKGQKNKIAIALLQESYTGVTGIMNGGNARIIQYQGIKTEPVKAAIAVFDGRLSIIMKAYLTTENVAVAMLHTGRTKIGIISVYFEDTKPLTLYINKIKIILGKLVKKKVVIGRDMNAWSSRWGSKMEDDKGEELMGQIIEKGYNILNQGNTPTFYTIRGGKEYQSCVDITICTNQLLKQVHSWTVDQELVNSDHNCIKFKISIEKFEIKQQKKTTRIYKTEKAKWTEFRSEINKQII